MTISTKSIIITTLIVSILLYLSQILFLNHYFFSALYNVPIFTKPNPKLAQCDLPSIFQDENLLQNYRSQLYPGSMQSDSYVVGFPHLFKVGGTSMKSMLRDQASHAHMDVRSLPNCKTFCTKGGARVFKKCVLHHSNATTREELRSIFTHYNKRYIKGRRKRQKDWTLNKSCLKEIMNA